MYLLKKLQTRYFQKDVKNGKNPEKLAEKYPMSMLVENEIFERIPNTEIYRPNSLAKELYNLKSELLGKPCLFNDEDQYVVVSKNNGEFKNGNENTSYAVYDKQGNCVIPHNCYSRCYFSEGYVVLSTAMKSSPDMDREERITTPEDEQLKMHSTGKSLVETLGGSTKNPKALIVAGDRIITTNYLSVEPLKPYGELDVYPKNAIWISQNDKNQEITFKFNKHMKLLETYRLPMFAHNFEMFFIDDNTGAVYLLDTENKRRINLRTGDYINLLNLKRAHLAKRDIFANPEEQEKIDDIVDGVIIEDVVSISLEDVVEELVAEKPVEEVASEELEFVETAEEFDLSIVGDDEVGDYEPLLDENVKDDRVLVCGDAIVSVGSQAEVPEEIIEIVEDNNI